MPSGWGSYYVVFLSAVLALGIPAVLAVLSFLVSPRLGPRVSPRRPAAPAERLGRRLNPRFFLAVNALIVLVALVLVIVPCTSIIRAASDRSEMFKGVLAIVTVASFAMLGLLYSAKNGDLGWLGTFKKDP